MLLKYMSKIELHYPDEDILICTIRPVLSDQLICGICQVQHQIKPRMYHLLVADRQYLFIFLCLFNCVANLVYGRKHLYLSPCLKLLGSFINIVCFYTKTQYIQINPTFSITKIKHILKLFYIYIFIIVKLFYIILKLICL